MSRDGDVRKDQCLIQKIHLLTRRTINPSQYRYKVLVKPWVGMLCLSALLLMSGCVRTLSTQRFIDTPTRMIVESIPGKTWNYRVHVEATDPDPATDVFTMKMKAQRYRICNITKTQMGNRILITEKTYDPPQSSMAMAYVFGGLGLLGGGLLAFTSSSEEDEDFSDPNSSTMDQEDAGYLVLGLSALAVTWAISQDLYVMDTSNDLGEVIIRDKVRFEQPCEQVPADGQTLTMMCEGTKTPIIHDTLSQQGLLEHPLQVMDLPKGSCSLMIDDTPVHNLKGFAEVLTSIRMRQEEMAVQSLLQHAQTAFEQQNYAEATQLAEQCTQTNTFSGDVNEDCKSTLQKARLELTKSLMKQQEYKAAAEISEKCRALGQNPECQSLQLQALHAYAKEIKRKAPEEALSLMTQCLEIENTHASCMNLKTDLLATLGRKDLKEKKPALALSKAEACLALLPKKGCRKLAVDATIAQGLAFIRNSKFNAAKASVEKCQRFDARSSTCQRFSKTLEKSIPPIWVPELRWSYKRYDRGYTLNLSIEYQFERRHKDLRHIEIQSRCQVNGRSIVDSTISYGSMFNGLRSGDIIRDEVDLYLNPSLSNPPSKCNVAFFFVTWNKRINITSFSF